MDKISGKMHTGILLCLFIILSLQFVQVTPEIITNNSKTTNASNLEDRILGNASTSNKTNVPMGLSFHTVAITITMYSFIFLIGFFGNALVIFVVFWNKSLQHNTNYCLVNLSIADLLLIIVCMPSAIVDLYAKEVWYFGYVLCKIIPWLEHTIAHASILTIVAISAERSLAIVFPLKAIHICTKKRLFMVVILIWIISGLSSLPIMTATVYDQKYHKQIKSEVNVCYSVITNRWQIIYLFISLFFFYMLPCLLLFILYGKIVYVIKNRNVAKLTAIGRNKYNDPTTSTYQSKNSKYNVEKQSLDLNETDVILKHELNIDGMNATRKSLLLKKKKLNNESYKKSTSVQPMNQKQIIILLIIMMFLILLLLLPYRVFSIWTALATSKQLTNLGINNYYSILNFCRVTFYINSAINPIFYHILSSKFQNAFRNVLKRTASKNTNMV